MFPYCPAFLHRLPLIRALRHGYRSRPCRCLSAPGFCRYACCYYQRLVARKCCCFRGISRIAYRLDVYDVAAIPFQRNITSPAGEVYPVIMRASRISAAHDKAYIVVPAAALRRFRYVDSPYQRFAVRAGVGQRTVCSGIRGDGYGCNHIAGDCSAVYGSCVAFILRAVHADRFQCKPAYLSLIHISEPTRRS